MPKVTRNAELDSFPEIDKIAVGLALFEASDKQAYPDFLGHYGDLNNSPIARESELRKLHIALSQADFNLRTWCNFRGFNRTCDNFLVYVQHWAYPDYFQILEIVSPEAHKNVDKFINDIVQKAETFYALRREQLAQLAYVDEHIQMAETIILTK